MLNTLNKTKEKLLNQQNAIETNIRELETRKRTLSEQLEKEFDNQVEADLNGTVYDENIAKEINSQLMEIQGRLQAYNRQLSKHSITDQDKENILKEAAEEYKKTAIENFKRTLRQYELDKKIRELMNEGEQISRIEDSSIYSQLKYSKLFPGMDERELKNEVTLRADVNNDEEYITLLEKLKPYNNKTSIYDRFTWTRQN